MRKVFWKGVGVGIVTMLAVAGQAQAQVFTPTYMSPVPLSDLGVYISDGPGDLTLEGIWRGGPLGLRVGFVDAHAEDLLSVGAEFRSPIALTGAPIGLAFTVGGQALVGDGEAIGIQAGLTAGHRFLSPGIAFTPYIHPRIAFINGFGENDGFESEILADLGVDVEFAQNLVFRFGVGLGDPSAEWGIGLAWRR